MTGVNPLARYTSHPLQTLVVMRAALGLAQSVMMPSVSATAARSALSSAELQRHIHLITLSMLECLELPCIKCFKA